MSHLTLLPINGLYAFLIFNYYYELEASCALSPSVPSQPRLSRSLMLFLSHPYIPHIILECHCKSPNMRATVFLRTECKYDLNENGHLTPNRGITWPSIRSW